MIKKWHKVKRFVRYKHFLRLAVNTCIITTICLFVISVATFDMSIKEVAVVMIQENKGWGVPLAMLSLLIGEYL